MLIDARLTWGTNSTQHSTSYRLWRISCTTMPSIYIVFKANYLFGFSWVDKCKPPSYTAVNILYIYSPHNRHGDDTDIPPSSPWQHRYFFLSLLVLTWEGRERRRRAIEEDTWARTLPPQQLPAARAWLSAAGCALPAGSQQTAATIPSAEETWSKQITDQPINQSKLKLKLNVSDFPPPPQA